MWLHIHAGIKVNPKYPTRFNPYSASLIDAEWRIFFLSNLSLAQIMACRLISAKLLSESMQHWTLKNKFHWNLNLNSYIFIQENAFGMSCAKCRKCLSRTQYDKYVIGKGATRSYDCIIANETALLSASGSQKATKRMIYPPENKAQQTGVHILRDILHKCVVSLGQSIGKRFLNMRLWKVLS